MVISAISQSGFRPFPRPPPGPRQFFRSNRHLGLASRPLRDLGNVERWSGQVAVPTSPEARIWRFSGSGKPVFRGAEWVSRPQIIFFSRVGVPSLRRTPRGGCGWRLVAGAGEVARSARSANLSPEPSPKPTDIFKMVRSPTEEISPAPGNVRIRKCANFGGPTPIERML